MTVPRGGARLPRPVAVTVAVRVVVLAVVIEVGLAAKVVVLGNCGVSLPQFVTRFSILTLPRPVAALYPALWLKADSNVVVDSERIPYRSVVVFV